MSPVDDIIINKQMPQKKKGKGILVVFFLLLIILVGLCGAYWYMNIRETPKALFFKYVGQTNIPEIIDTEIYYNILEKMNSESYETSTTANFTTTKETEFTKNVDVSNFEFTLDTASDKENEAAQIGANITYSSNDFFDLKFISTKDSMAIGSNEILDKYIATSKTELANSINRTTGFETEINADIPNEEMNKFADNRINLDEVYASEKANEYMTSIVEKIPEEAVTLTEASQVTINSEIINTNAYTLNLDASTYSSLTTEILTKLRNDTEFLNKIVTGNSTEIVEEKEEVENVPVVKPLTIERVEGQTEEHQTAQEISEELEVISGPDTGALLTSEEENLEVVSEPDNGELLKTTEEEDLEVVKEPDTGALLKDETEDSILTEIIGAILFNQKLDMTVEELQNKLDDELSNLNITEGIKVTVYVKDVEGEENQTIKLVADLPDNANLDIEYPEVSKAKITFLEDVEEENELGEIVTKNVGMTIEVKRTNTDMQTDFDITLSSIEEKKVVAKIQIDLTTKGTTTSKNYSNNAIIKYNDGEGDVKVNIKNNIDFKNTEVVEELTDENAIFVDKLSDEEATNLFTTIITKLMEVYSEKIVNMNFIDNNSSGGLIEQPDSGEVVEEQPEEIINTEEENVSSLEITKLTARDLLIKKIEEMMTEAQNSGEEFTIQNLNNLPEQIDGHNVSSIITEEQATVKIAGYTFYIDKDFMLTEE